MFCQLTIVKKKNAALSDESKSRTSTEHTKPMLLFAPVTDGINDKTFI